MCTWHDMHVEVRGQFLELVLSYHVVLKTHLRSPDLAASIFTFWDISLTLNIFLLENIF